MEKFQNSVTRKLRSMERKPSSKKLAEFIATAQELGVSLYPWQKRIDALQRLTIVFEVQTQ